jgi:hypothetical protein
VREDKVDESRSEYLQRLQRNLGKYSARYASSTVEERQELRCAEPAEDLAAFHRLMSEELEDILKVLDQFDWREISEDWQPIANLVLFLAEIDSAVVKWIPRFGLAHLPDALDPRHFESKRNFNDVEPRQGSTLLSERIR